MYFDRMDTLLQILRTVDERQFRMETWGVNFNDDGDVLKDSCGFAGCAMGWAAQSPYFQKLGLRLRRCATALRPLYVTRLVFHGPDGIELDGFLAAAAVFGITADAAKCLFDPEAYDDTPDVIIKPKHVIARIEDFMRQQVSA